MYQYNFKNGLFRIDDDYYFESRYICFTFFNLEFDRDILMNSFSIGIMGLHFTLVWRN